MPNYANYVKRGQLTDATMLANYRVKMEQYYQDANSYSNNGACGIALPATQFFTYACQLDTTAGAAAGQSFTITATGIAGTGTAGFNYTINEQDIRASSGSGTWAGNATCWSVKQDGSC
jgi:type IV pilus assembly protein PilE